MCSVKCSRSYKYYYYASQRILHGGSGGMAGIRLQTSTSFNLRNPDDWPRWKRRFQQCRKASGLADATDSKQVSTLLYCLGEEEEAVLATTNLTAVNRNDYDRVLVKFDDFFLVRKTVILRARAVQPEEPAEHRVVRAIHHG